MGDDRLVEPTPADNILATANRLLVEPFRQQDLAEIIRRSIDMRSARITDAMLVPNHHKPMYAPDEDLADLGHLVSFVNCEIEPYNMYVAQGGGIAMEIADATVLNDGRVMVGDNGRFNPVRTWQMRISAIRSDRFMSINPSTVALQPKCVVDLTTVSHFRAPVSPTRDRTVRVPTLGCRIFVNSDNSVKIVATRMDADGRVFVDSADQVESGANLPSVKSFLKNLILYGLK